MAQDRSNDASDPDIRVSSGPINVMKLGSSKRAVPRTPKRSKSMGATTKVNT
jgi:hypothetical protein